MANQIKFKIDGIDGIIRQLDAIERGKNAAERTALRGGGAPIRVSAKKHAVKGKHGLLSKSIGLNVKKVKGRLTARIGPRGGFEKIEGIYSRGKRKGQPRRFNPIYYSHLVEFGTSHSPAKPFIRPAIADSKDEVVSAMASAIEKHLIRKQARAAARASA